LARRLVPRFTRGIAFLLFAFYVMAAGGKDDPPLRRSLASSRARQLLIDDF